MLMFLLPLVGKAHRLLAFLALGGLLLLSHPRPATAQNIDAKLFDPAVSPHAIFNTHASRTLGHLVLYGHLFTNYANDLLVGRRGAQVVTRPIAHRFTTEFGAAIGLSPWFDLAISLPIYLRQFSEMEGLPAQSSGLGDLRIMAKGQLLKNKRFGGFGLALAAEVAIPIGPENLFMRGPSTSFTPRIIADFRIPERLAIALNIAYGIQGKTTLGNLVIGSELRISLGAELFLPQNFSLVAEANTAFGDAMLGILQRDPPSAAEPASSHAPVEALLAMRWRHASGVTFSFGGGFGISAGYGAPDFRILLGIGYQHDFLRRPKPTPPPPTRPTAPTKRNPPPQAPPRKTSQLSPKDFDKALTNDADRDSDGDGIPDKFDKCPHQPEDFDKFQDEDGCPDLDNDRDGIPDKYDKCPNQPETINGIDDEDGCPDKGKGKVLLDKGKIRILDKVYFDSSSDRLKPRSYSILRQVAAFIKANWQIRLVRIDGHTDNVGNLEMNVDLSERRARRVMTFLIKRGVAPNRLKAKGFGPKKPIDSNNTNPGRAKNRRVEFLILKVFVPPKANKARKGGAR